MSEPRSVDQGQFNADRIPRSLPARQAFTEIIDLFKAPADGLGTRLGGTQTPRPHAVNDDLLVFGGHLRKRRFGELLFLGVEKDGAGNVTVSPATKSSNVDERHTPIEQYFRHSRIDGGGARDFSR